MATVTFGSTELIKILKEREGGQKERRKQASTVTQRRKQLILKGDHTHPTVELALELNLGLSWKGGESRGGSFSQVEQTGMQRETT